MAQENGALGGRKAAILKAVVEAYIRTGEPVASKSLADGFDFSPATLRNEMSALTEMGYLEQPHTSAGRVPSEAGYRLYVDNLMQSYALTAGELGALNDLVKSKAAELDGILDRAGKVMSTLTNYPALAVTAGTPRGGATQFRLTRYDETSFLLSAIVSPEDVKSRLVQAGTPIADATLRALEDVLNRSMAGRAMQDVNLPLLRAMELQMGSAAPLVDLCAKAIYAMFEEAPRGGFRLDGVTKLLEYPEYADTAPLRAMLGGFDDKQPLLDLVAGASDDKTRVFIGSENPLDSSNSSALVLRTITDGGRVVGALGIIGPCRMDYAKVITAVDYLTEHIRGMLSPSAGALGSGDDTEQ